jgi:hypothetical protein
VPEGEEESLGLPLEDGELGASEGCGEAEALGEPVGALEGCASSLGRGASVAAADGVGPP